MAPTNVSLVNHCVTQRKVIGMINLSFVLVHHLRHAGQHILSQRMTGWQQFFSRDDAIDQSPLIGLLRRQKIAGQRKLLGPSKSNRPRQSSAEPPASNQANPCMGIGKSRLWRDYEQIAGKRYLKATGNGCTVYRSDNRLVPARSNDGGSLG